MWSVHLAYGQSFEGFHRNAIFFSFTKTCNFKVNLIKIITTSSSYQRSGHYTSYGEHNSV